MISLAVSRAYTEAHKDDLTLSQRQDLARWRGEKWVTPYAKPNDRLTPAEIEWLAERLAGVNDPIGVEVLRKLKVQ
jgi:hypothetical protein